MMNVSIPEQERIPPDVNRMSTHDISSQQYHSTLADFHPPYWTFLFDNLKRSIEQIYQTCQSDRNRFQCQEIIDVLASYCHDFENLMETFDNTQLHQMKRKHLSSSLMTLSYDTEKSYFRPFEHSQSICNGDLYNYCDLPSRQKYLHNSDMNLNLFTNRISTDTTKLKRQRSTKSRKTNDSLSLLSLPTFVSSTTLTNDSSLTLVPTKRSLTDETAAADADDEKDIRDESIDTNRHHRYHHQLSTSSHCRFSQQDLTSEDDDEDLLLRNERGMIDFMDRQIFDVFDQEESLTAALEAEQERTIASLMAEQEDLEHQLNNVSDYELLGCEDDGSELEESELSTTKTSSYFMSLQDEHDDKDASPNDLSRDDNDSENDGKSRTKHLRIHEKLSSPSRIRPLSETLREAAERQERALTRRQTFRDERARKMRELTQRVNEVRQWKEELIKARKTTIEMKMHRAEEKRQYLLLLKAKKAGDEDLKGQEIAFIKLLQQENRRQTLKERYQKEEQLKQILEEERVRKHDEHKQRELAAENRRKELEALRQVRLNQMQEKWKNKERMIEQHFIEKRRQIQSAAIAKQKTLQQKRAERVAYLKASTVELKKKLALKQEESARRHVTQLEEIRRKAIEMSTFRGASAEDQHHRHHSSPVIDNNKSTISTNNLGINDEPIPTRKFCTLCNRLLASDFHLKTHLRDVRHNQLLMERISQKNENSARKQPTQDEINNINTEAITLVTNDNIVRQEMSYARERKHAMKKRAKKLRLRMAQRSAAYEAENSQRPYLTSTHKARIQRFLNELEKSLNTTARKEPLNTANYLACQRILTEFVKIFDIHGYEKDSPLEQRVFFSLNGYATLTKMIELRAECNKPPLAPESLIALTASVYRAATKTNLDNAFYILNSGKILSIVDSLLRHLNSLKIDDLVSSNTEQSESEKIALVELIINLTEILVHSLTIYNSSVNDIRKRDNETNEDKLTISRLTDLISYIANVGVLDRLASLFRTVRAFVNATKLRISDMIIQLLNLLQQMIEFSRPKGYLSPFVQPVKKSISDPAQVLNIMKSTNFCEILSLLYGILIYEGDSNNNNNNQNLNQNHNAMAIHEKTFIIVNNSLNLMNTIATLDLDTFQTTLGEDTISLQLRHVANYILAYCNQQQTQMNENILQQIILLIGYYCVLNQDNQCHLAFGNRPTVLQQLSCLPFRYFVESKYMNILFPTLITCTYDCETTRAILQTEMSLDLIVNYIQATLDENTSKDETDITLTFDMRFPREQWSNALEYYRTIFKPTTNNIEMLVEKSHNDEDKENMSHVLNDDIEP